MSRSLYPDAAIDGALICDPDRLTVCQSLYVHARRAWLTTPYWVVGIEFRYKQSQPDVLLMRVEFEAESPQGHVRTWAYGHNLSWEKIIVHVRDRERLYQRWDILKATLDEQLAQGFADEIEAAATLCENCGQPLRAWACGPTHAAERKRRGWVWDRVEPGTKETANA